MFGGLFYLECVIYWVFDVIDEFIIGFVGSKKLIVLKKLNKLIINIKFDKVFIVYGYDDVVKIKIVCFVE